MIEAPFFWTMLIFILAVGFFVGALVGSVWWPDTCLGGGECVVVTDDGSYTGNKLLVGKRGRILLWADGAFWSWDSQKVKSIQFKDKLGRLPESEKVEGDSDGTK